jgi:putative ABC transport system permease protein
MNTLAQIAAVLRLSLGTLPQRRGPSSVIVIGMAGVVAVFISLQALAIGFRVILDLGSRPDRVMVVTKGALGTLGSVIGRNDAPTIMDTPGVKRDADGAPIASASVFADFPVTKKADGLLAFTMIQGVGPKGMQVWPERRLIAGRMFQPGLREMIVGRSALSQYEGLDLGAQVNLPGGDWTVVGVFTTDGGIGDSMAVGDADTLMAALSQANFSAVNLKMDSPASYAQVSETIATNPSLAADAFREIDYYTKRYEWVMKLLRTTAIVLGALMAVGTSFGALNTMYSAVADRRREIGTLRALGFGGVAVVISVLVEALLLCAIGALIGTAIAWLAFDGSEHVIQGAVVTLKVTPAIVAMGIGLAGLVALLGGLFPALRAARMPIVDALRAS